ncbi:MAG TPA: carbonic anhydrase [Actinomycetota bacterium]|nr:carbonic anhydrase [Actinomycetota bacterium]
MAVFDDLLTANQAFSASFASGDLPMPPARPVAVLTCMDARLHPERFLGLEIGDAHVIRNAGGRASDDAIRSLVISERLLGTDEIVVIHHTDCGMLTFKNQQLVDKIREELGADASAIDFLAFADLEESVLADVETLRRSDLIPDDVSIAGAIYEVETGRLHEVTRK